MSVSHSAHGDLGFNMEKPIGDRLMTQSSNVQIGDPKLKSAFYQTTYEVSNQNRSLANKSAASKCVAKEGSHFQIGNASRPTGMSQHQATYIPLNHAASKPDKDFETRIRSNHFDLGMGNPLPGQYNSVSQSAHDFKGDAQAIKSKLDADRKIDLTASHFKIGEGKSRMISTMKGDYVDNGGSQSAFNDDKRRDLRNSHFMLGDPSKVDFKTTHDINYKWVQPRKAPL